MNCCRFSNGKCMSIRSYALAPNSFCNSPTTRVNGLPVDFLVCDEAQFYSAEQVEQLARVVDELGIDVFAFGITTDFRTKLFPGSSRLIELADRVEVVFRPVRHRESLTGPGARRRPFPRVDWMILASGVQALT